MTKTARSSAASRGWRFAVRGSGLTICLLAICCLSFAARVFLLDTQSIWWDEAISIHLATSSARELLANRAAHVHPPLYFLILKGWVELAGVSAFSVRFLSVWFNTVLVPVIYALGRRWLGRRTGLLASILMALSPLYIIYSQEARVYAMLPLVYLALLALGERLARGRSPAPWTYWLLLAAVETVGLYLHYVFLFAVGYVNLLLILGLRRRRHEWLRWLASQAVVVLLCLPWVVAAALRWDAILADIGVGDPFVEPVPLGYFSRLLWSFQWSGLSAAPGYVPLYATALVLAVLLPGALVRLTVAPPTRAATLRLLAHWFVPLIPALLMWQAKPLSHPRYVSVFVVALLLLVGYVLDHLARGRWAEKGLAALLGLAILAATVISLRAYYFDPRFAKDDTRGVAAAIAAQSSASDLVVVPPEDWSVPYYYDGPARVEMPWPGDAATDWEQLANLTQGREGAYLVDYYRATRDPWGLLPFAFESAGSLSDRWDFKGLYVRLY
ncbi:MAG: glycosyltransferase family 39 protein, partial [Anaerolineae bacterium]